MRRFPSRFWIYLVINIIVSALTTILILAISHAGQAKNPTYSFLLTPVSQDALFPSQAEAQIPTLPAMDAPTLKITNLYGNGDLQTEFIKIQMVGSGELWLTNWQIKDDKKHVYTFPRLQLNNGGTVNIYTKNGVDSVTDLYWGLKEPLWSSGDTITILDYDGNIRAEYQVP
jgi:hypothetical protein